MLRAALARAKGVARINVASASRSRLAVLSLGPQRMMSSFGKREDDGPEFDSFDDVRDMDYERDFEPEGEEGPDMPFDRDFDEEKRQRKGKYLSKLKPKKAPAAPRVKTVKEKTAAPEQPEGDEPESLFAEPEALSFVKTSSDVDSMQLQSRLQLYPGGEKRDPLSFTERRQAAPWAYVAKPRVTTHTRDDCGKYYPLDPVVYERSHPILNKQLEPETSYTPDEAYMMIRQPGLEVVEYLKKVEAGNDGALRFSVGGAPGSGKSFTLHYIQQYAIQQKWLVLNTSGREFPHERLGFIRASEVDVGIWDQPLYTKKWFASLLEHQRDQLAKIPVLGEYSFEWNPPENLAEMLEWCVDEAADEQVGTVLDGFVTEIKQQADVPTLILADDYNEWDLLSSFTDPNTMRRIPSRNMGLVSAFDKLIQEPPASGVSIIGLTSKAHLRNARKHIAGTLHVSVPNYSDQDVVTAVHYYHHSTVLLKPLSSDLGFMGQLKMYSGNVPAHVREYCSVELEYTPAYYDRPHKTANFQEVITLDASKAGKGDYE